MRKLLVALALLAVGFIASPAQAQSIVTIVLGSSYANGVVTYTTVSAAGTVPVAPSPVLTQVLSAAGGLNTFFSQGGSVFQVGNTYTVLVCKSTGASCLYTTVVPNNTTQDITAALQANPFSGGGGGSGVTSVATTSPITGGTITTTGTVACASCVTSSSPGAGIGRFAGGTQAVTSAELSGDATTSGSNAVTVIKINGNTPGGTCTNQVVSAESSSAIPTCHTIVATDIANGTITGTQLNSTIALPNGATATTQAGADNTTKVATDAFVIANAGGVSAGTYFSVGGYVATGHAAVANTSRCVGVVIPPGGLSVGHLTVYVSTADNVNNNDLGFYTHAGTLEAHIGAQHIASTGSQTFAFSGGTKTISAGAEWFCQTSVGSTFAIELSDNASTWFQYADATTVTSGGALANTLTPPADAPQVGTSANGPAFTLTP